MGDLHFDPVDAVDTDLASEVPAVRCGVGPEFDPTGLAAEQTASAASHRATAEVGRAPCGGRCSRIMRIMAHGMWDYRSQVREVLPVCRVFCLWHMAQCHSPTGEEAESMLFAFEVLTSLVVLPLGPPFLQGISSMGVEAADQGAGRG
jgi:hypothetical protein